jgi:hypothetical protein
MIMRTTSDTEIRELDRRIHDGIDVRLLWNARTNLVTVAVDDERSGESFELCVDGREALFAFHHPFAYASSAPADRALAA